LAELDVVEVSVTVAARVATVFRFLSDPERFRRWMGAGSTIDPVPGGRLEVMYPTGDVAVGEVVTLVPGERLAFRWGHEGGRHGLPLGSTLVTVSLRAVDGGTLVTLRHEGIPRVELRDGLASGWRYYLGVLAVTAAEAQLAGVLEPAVDAYIAAWNEDDAAKRWSLLERCWTSDGVFRDAVGYAAGRAALASHIGSTRMLAPGLLMERAGRADACHDRVRFPWRVSGPAGVLATGWNYGEVTPEGEFRAMAGFWDASAADREMMSDQALREAADRTASG
jgi:uncharacterized protein YndB with AHSA1/START domain